MILATLSGTPTWSTRRLGSGEMTVRPEKSTRFPFIVVRDVRDSMTRTHVGNPEKAGPC